MKHRSAETQWYILVRSNLKKLLDKLHYTFIATESIINTLNIWQ